MNGERRAFAARLNDVCTDRRLPERGRQSELAKLFKVSQQAARKWLEGAGYPSIDTAREISRWGKVNFDWLMTGRGTKMSCTENEDPAIEHVVKAMRAMEPEKRYLVEKLTITIAGS